MPRAALVGAALPFELSAPGTVSRHLVASRWVEAVATVLDETALGRTAQTRR